MDLQVKILKADSCTTARQKPLLLHIITSKAVANYSFPLVKGDDKKKTYFKMYFLKSTFLKDVTDKFTFCWKVLLVTLSTHLVAATTTLCHYLLIS